MREVTYEGGGMRSEGIFSKIRKLSKLRALRFGLNV